MMLGLLVEVLSEIGFEELRQLCIASVTVPKLTDFKKTRRVQYRLLMFTYLVFNFLLIILSDFAQLFSIAELFESHQ